MRSPKFFLLPTIIYLSLNLNLHAQELKDSIAEVVIEGKSLEYALQERQQAIPEKIVVSQKDLRSFGHLSAGDIIKYLPRIYVEGTPTVTRNFMMAGLEREYQSILVNGKRPAGGESERNFKLDRIPVDMIDRVEILYNAPVDYSSDGIGGTLNILLKDSLAYSKANIHLSAASKSMSDGLDKKAGVDYYKNFGKLSVLINASYDEYNWDIEHTVHDLETELKGNIFEWGDAQLAALNTSISWKPNNKHEINLHPFVSYFYEDEYEDAKIKKSSDGSVSNRESFTNSEKFRTIQLYDLNHKLKLAKGELNTILSVAISDEQREKNREAEKTDGLYESIEDEPQDVMEYYLKSELKHVPYTLAGIDSKLKIGAITKYNNREVGRLTYERKVGNLLWDSEDFSYELKEFIVGAYAASDFQVSEKLQTSIGAKGEFTYNDYVTAIDEGTAEYTDFTPSLMTKYAINSKIAMRAGISHQISRPPYASAVPIDKIKIKKELIERGNPDLESSKAMNYNLGVDFFLNKTSYISVSGFYKAARKMVESKFIGYDDNTGYEVYQFVNVDSAKVYGFTTEYRLERNTSAGHNFILYGNVSLLGSEVRDPGTRKLRQINEQPNYIVNHQLEYLNTKLRIGLALGLNQVGERVLHETITNEGEYIPGMTIEPFNQLDFRAKYYISNRLNIYFKGVNLLNEKSRTMQGNVSEISTFGSHYRLGINYTF